VAIANNEDTVIEVATADAVEDTRLVGLEAGLISLDGDGDGFTIIGSAKGILSVGNILVAGDLGVSGHSAGCRLASATASSVRVSSLSAETMSHDVLEGVIHETAVATTVTIRASAVNKLLLGERGEVAVADSNNTLDRAGGRESPARAALTLIFHTSDSGLGGPVN